MCVCVYVHICLFVCVCARAAITFQLTTSAGAVRSASLLASQIKDVTAAASCPAAAQLQIDHTLFTSPLPLPQSLSPRDTADPSPDMRGTGGTMSKPHHGH